MLEKTELTQEAYAFMRQEHDRIIDAYHDLHLQKNELIKFYLAFASIPVSIVAILLSSYRYLEVNPQLGTVLGALRGASVYLSILLVFVGVCVVMVMLKIRGEQYLYVKTINGTRKFFKDNCKIAEVYLVLPSEINDITFGEQERRGRAFWEAMIVCSITSMLLAFLGSELALRHFEIQNYWLLVAIAVVIFVVSLLSFRYFVRAQLHGSLLKLELVDSGAPARNPV